LEQLEERRGKVRGGVRCDRAERRVGGVREQQLIVVELIVDGE
jgi:hypothetical protein